MLAGNESRTSDVTLTEVCCHMLLALTCCRRTEPLPEAVVQQLVERYKQPHLLEHYRAANRKCLPSDTMT